MENLLEHLGTLAVQNPEWTSLILGVGILIQGEITVLVAFYLVVAGHISLFQFIISGLIGLFSGELLIFSLGKFLRHTRFGWRLSRKMKTNRRIQIYTYYLKQNTGRVLLLAKFVPGMNALTLFLFGWTRTKTSQFLKLYIPAALFWFSIASLISYGISSGLHYLKSSKTFTRVEFIVLGLILLFFIIEYAIKRIMRAREPKNIPISEEE